MKKLLFLLTLIVSLLALPPIAGAKDKDKDRDYERDKKRWKETRDDVRELREQHSRLVDSARQQQLSRGLWQDVNLIGTGVQRVSAQFERGSYDTRELRDDIGRLDAAISRVRQQMDYERSHPRRYYR